MCIHTRIYMYTSRYIDMHVYIYILCVYSIMYILYVYMFIYFFYKSIYFLHIFLHMRLNIGTKYSAVVGKCLEKLRFNLYIGDQQITSYRASRRCFCLLTVGLSKLFAHSSHMNCSSWISAMFLQVTTIREIYQ